MTQEALSYMPPGGLIHRFVPAGERCRLENGETAERTRMLRELLSAGWIRKLVTSRVAGEIETKMIEQKGPISLVESTTLQDVFGEDANRAIPLSTDESEDHTREIFLAQAKAHTAEPSDVRRICAVHHALQRIVARERKPVVIPFLKKLARRFPTKPLAARRAFQHVVSIIATSALLHFRQRKIKNGAIVAQRSDYELAAYLLAEPMARMLRPHLRASAQRLHAHLRERFTARQFSVRDIDAFEDLCEKQVRNLLHELVQNGLVRIIQAGARGRKGIYELDPGGGGSVLPSVKEIFQVEPRGTKAKA
jgi:hypothetical protein